MTGAARVRHDVVVMSRGRIQTLEDRTLAGPNDIEDVGSHIALGYGCLLYTSDAADE